MDKTIFTIGHSNLDIINFINLLLANKIELVIDVRSAPFSKMYPHFNRDSIESSLKHNLIKYLYFGDSIGGRSKNTGDYLKGRILYRKLAEKPEYISSIKKVIEIATKHRIVLMCSEKEPLECHRTLLVSRSIEMFEVKVLHIHGSGKIESQNETLQRLLGIWKLDAPDLFGEDADRLDQALTNQQNKFAYFDENMINKWEN